MPMYKEVVEEGLTYGQAVDKCIHEGLMISREPWEGYWKVPAKPLQLCQKDDFFSMDMNPMIVACLRDEGGFVSAVPYPEDMFATDWQVVR
ncbi:Thoeris anti-defense Tad2 family protein [Priestia megaterium]|uniref:Thoeris anti-defense Tad2 family protein n=1 Tax=Priestia megaterium TaxID=1404 RepID=UPI003D05330E